MMFKALQQMLAKKQQEQSKSHLTQHMPETVPQPQDNQAAAVAAFKKSKEGGQVVQGGGGLVQAAQQVLQQQPSQPSALQQRGEANRYHVNPPKRPDPSGAEYFRNFRSGQPTAPVAPRPRPVDPPQRIGGPAQSPGRFAAISRLLGRRR